MEGVLLASGLRQDCGERWLAAGARGRGEPGFPATRRESKGTSRWGEWHIWYGSGWNRSAGEELSDSREQRHNRQKWSLPDSIQCPKWSGDAVCVRSSDGP